MSAGDRHPRACKGQVYYSSVKSSKKPRGHSKTTVSKKKEVRYSSRPGLLFGSEASETLNLLCVQANSTSASIVESGTSSVASLSSVLSNSSMEVEQSDSVFSTVRQDHSAECSRTMDDEVAPDRQEQVEELEGSSSDEVDHESVTNVGITQTREDRLLQLMEMMLTGMKEEREAKKE